MGDLFNTIKEFFRKPKLEEMKLNGDLITEKNILDMKKGWDFQIYGPPEKREYIGSRALKKIRRFARRWNYSYVFLDPSDLDEDSKNFKIDAVFYRGFCGGNC